MAQVIVHVNDRPYNMVCDDGEEEHLTELVSLIEDEVVKLKKTFGQVGDSRLLLMAGLVVADKLSEAERRIDSLEGEMEGLKDARNVAVDRMREFETSFAERMISMAERIEGLADDFSADGK